jgi:Phospholipase_D-nuclease N-terminal
VPHNLPPLLPVLAVAAAFVAGCLIDLLHARVCRLPKWVWAVIICAQIPLGGLAYLVFGRDWTRPRVRRGQWDL